LVCLLYFFSRRNLEKVTMTKKLQIPSRLVLTTTRISDWKSNLSINPITSPEQPSPSQPGQKVGDLLLKTTQNGPAKLWVSLGNRENLTSSTIRKAGESCGQWLVEHHAQDVGIEVSLFAMLGVEFGLDAFCEGLMYGAFRFDRHKSTTNTSSPVQVQVLTEGNGRLEDRLKRVTVTMNGVNLAREWSHEPANVINPITLAQRAKDLSTHTDLKCTVLGKHELEELGAGAILSVGLGSKTPSQLIILEHPSHGEQKGSAPVVIAGKAITFDTGGYSLKDKTGIVGMKFDKCGGMAVFGIMQAVAELELDIPVVGIIAAAENMISSEAYRPNDIITSLCGKTIEIISTDAEGRMVLADALTYAGRQFKPRALIDLATLTGGVAVALGKVRAGLMSNNEALAGALFNAGERTQERLWQLPLDDDYFELIRGHDSDLKNSAGLNLAHTIVGGMFLKEFVPEGIPWAHIDIANLAIRSQKNNTQKDATGFGVRLLVDYLSSL
jgi:leucyl aminopeptidase